LPRGCTKAQRREAGRAGGKEKGSLLSRGMKVANQKHRPGFQTNPEYVDTGSMRKRRVQGQHIWGEVG